MHTFRTFQMFSLAILLVFLLAACGGSSSQTITTPASSNNAGSTTPAANQTAPTQVTPTTASSGTAVVKTMMGMVQGKSQTILTDAKGFTLYYFKPDTRTKSACADACAKNWPPLMPSGSSTPTSATSLPGKLVVQSSVNGPQVQYNGHFLYTFVSDKAAGDTKGEGVGDKWYVATPDLAELS